MLPSPGQLYIRVAGAAETRHEFGDLEYRRITLTYGKKKKVLLKTRQVYGIGAPEWNEEFVVVIPKMSSTLVWTLWEKSASKSKEKAVGSAYLDWKDLSPWRLLEQKIPITDSLQLTVYLEYGPMQVPDGTPITTKLPEMRYAFERLVYWPGETVRGVLTLSIAQARRIQGLQLRFNGFNYIDWYDENTDCFFTGTDIYFTKRQMLLGQAPPPSKKVREMAKKNGENWIGMKEEFLNVGISSPEYEGVEVESGVHHFPFEFLLPTNLPPSVSLMDDCVGIFYFVEAHLFELGHGSHVKKPIIHRQTLHITATRHNTPDTDPGLAPIETETILISKTSPILADQYTTTIHEDDETELAPSDLVDGFSPPKTSFTGLDFLEQTHLKTRPGITDIDLEGDTDDSQWLSEQKRDHLLHGQGIVRTQSPFALGTSPTEKGLGADYSHHYQNGQHSSDDDHSHEDDLVLTPREDAIDEKPRSRSSSRSRSRSKSTGASRHAHSPILVTAVVPSYASVGKSLTFQVTIENRSNKPINALRIQLRSTLGVSGHRGGRVYRKLLDATSNSWVLRIVEKDLPQFPIQPDTAWRGNVTIGIPSNLYPTLQVRHLSLAYDLILEARTTHKILAGHVKTPFTHVSNECIKPLTIIQTAPEKELRLIKPPATPTGDPCLLTLYNSSRELENTIVPLPISPEGKIPSTGFLFASTAFTSSKKASE